MSTNYSCWRRNLCGQYSETGTITVNPSTLPVSPPVRKTLRCVLAYGNNRIWVFRPNDCCCYANNAELGDASFDGITGDITVNFNPPSTLVVTSQVFDYEINLLETPLDVPIHLRPFKDKSHYLPMT